MASEEQAPGALEDALDAHDAQLWEALNSGMAGTLGVAPHVAEQMFDPHELADQANELDRQILDGELGQLAVSMFDDSFEAQ